MRKDRTSESTRFGLTLLELLISMSLMIVLISILWSLIHMYSDYYAAGTHRIDRAQLVRSLSQLLGDDLGAAIQDPIHPLPPSLVAGDVVRRFGLFGTSDSLRVDVIQINPLAPGSDMYSARRAAVGPVQNVKMQVPELKTIYYDFLPLTAQSVGKPSGLVRRELSFETPVPTNNSSQTVNFGEETVLENPLFPTKPTTIAEQLLRENDPDAMWAPEIVELRFRYGNGTNWVDSWDSLKKNGLPVAVEVTLKLMQVGDVEKLRKKSSFLPQTVAGTDTEESFDSIRPVGSPFENTTPLSTTPNTSQTLESLARELGLAPPVEQRLVVYLATSPLIKSDPIRRPVPPAVPKPPTPTLVSPPSPPRPAPPEPTVPSQQWLRR